MFTEKTSKQATLNNSLYKIFVAFSAVLVLTLANFALAQELPKKEDPTNTPEPIETKAVEKARKELEKKNEKEIKNIVDRAGKKDDYVPAIRNKFNQNANILESISNKIGARVTKLEILGEDVTEMNEGLENATENIKNAKKLLLSLPNKKTNLDEVEARKHAITVIEIKNLLEEAKTNLSNVITILKDLVIDKDNDKKD